MATALGTLLLLFSLLLALTNLQCTEMLDYATSPHQCHFHLDTELIALLQPANITQLHSAYLLHLNEDDLFKVAFRNAPTNNLEYIETAKHRLSEHRLNTFWHPLSGQYLLICRQITNWQMPGEMDPSIPIDYGKVFDFIVGHLFRNESCSTIETLCFFTTDFHKGCLLDFLQHHPEHFPQPQWPTSPATTPNLWSSIRQLTVCLLPTSPPPPPQQPDQADLAITILLAVYVIAVLLLLILSLPYICCCLQTAPDLPLEEYALRAGGGGGGGDWLVNWYTKPMEDGVVA